MHLTHIFLCTEFAWILKSNIFGMAFCKPISSSHQFNTIIQDQNMIATHRHSYTRQLFRKFTTFVDYIIVLFLLDSSHYHKWDKSEANLFLLLPPWLSLSLRLFPPMVGIDCVPSKLFIGEWFNEKYTKICWSEAQIRPTTYTEPFITDTWRCITEGVICFIVRYLHAYWIDPSVLLVLFFLKLPC